MTVFYFIGIGKSALFQRQIDPARIENRISNYFSITERTKIKKIHFLPPVRL
ncbi:hypothetical protein LEP1GSC193_4078 [Leptospira alstonii serovar Pingchang str. 80-412]|uniref:Uncharacterized protein n=2 Tax=Leptospira alstonii TaxID=28452 RepID=M6CIR7_9LEPT|nr:hypothetical protein LEP1GSC194_1151 [Leptospira alstonii serovar Sichuan str. 79601]EQA80490.1 hypothetical protein LEP1GSC193_4078 [Leptospira alstonii serovar Pingchang str. 80-412]